MIKVANDNKLRFKRFPKSSILRKVYKFHFILLLFSFMLIMVLEENSIELHNASSKKFT